MEFLKVPLDLMDPDPEQPRQEMDPDELRALALSLRDHGQLQPVIVIRGSGRHALIDGHRRFHAAKLLGWGELQAVVLDQVPDGPGKSILQLIVNCHRSDLKPLEKAHAFWKLKEARGWNSTQLAEHLRLSKGMVTQYLKLLELPPEMQAQVDSGNISASAAYALTRAPDEASRQALYEAARQGAMSRDQVASAVQKRGARKTSEAVRITCRMPTATITVTAREGLEVPDLQALFRKASQECRKAASQGWDVGTLERVMADRSRVQDKATTPE